MWTGHSKSGHCEDTQETQSPLFVQSSNLLLALRVGGWQFVCFEIVFYWYHLVYLICDGKGFISMTFWGLFFSHVLLVETNQNYSFTCRTHCELVCAQIIPEKVKISKPIKASEMLVAPRISECFGLGLL